MLGWVIPQPAIEGLTHGNLQYTNVYNDGHTVTDNTVDNDHIRRIPKKKDNVPVFYRQIPDKIRTFDQFYRIFTRGKSPFL